MRQWYSFSPSYSNWKKISWWFEWLWQSFIPQLCQQTPELHLGLYFLEFLHICVIGILSPSSSYLQQWLSAGRLYLLSNIYILSFFPPSALFQAVLKRCRGSDPFSWEGLGRVNHLFQNYTYFCVLLRVITPNLTPDPALLFLLFDGSYSYLWNYLLQRWE